MAGWVDVDARGFGICKGRPRSLVARALQELRPAAEVANEVLVHLHDANAGFRKARGGVQSLAVIEMKLLIDSDMVEILATGAAKAKSAAELSEEIRFAAARLDREVREVPYMPVGTEAAPPPLEEPEAKVGPGSAGCGPRASGGAPKELAPKTIAWTALGERLTEQEVEEEDGEEEVPIDCLESLSSHNKTNR